MTLTLTPTGYVLSHNGDLYPELTREQVVELALKLGVLAEAREQLDAIENQEK